MILYILILSIVAVVFNLTLPLMAGLYIVSDLGGSSYQTSYGVSFFCIGNVLGLPLGKPWMTRLSPIQLYVICLALMSFFSWECAVAASYFQFIVFRLLEGFASGPVFLLITYSLIPLLVVEKDKHLAKPLLLTCFSVTPVLGACWGGWIAYYHNWRTLFFTNIPICIFLILYVGYGYRKFHKPIAHSEFDSLAYCLFIIGVSFLGTVLTIGQELDWFRSPLICFLVLVGSLSLVLFVFRDLNLNKPIIDLKLLKNFYFCFSMINIGLLFAVYFGMVVLLSLWLKLYVNYTPNWIILIIGTMALGAWIPLFLHYQPYDSRYPLAIALVFLAISCFYTTNFNVQINFDRIAFSRGLAGIGLMLFVTPLFKLAVQETSAEKLAEKVNFFHIVRSLGSGLGVASFVILWHRRQVFYHERLGSKLTQVSQSTMQFFDHAKQFNLHGKEALAQLDYYLNRQATALALDDCFYLMGWLTIFLLILLIMTFILKIPLENLKHDENNIIIKQI